MIERKPILNLENFLFQLQRLEGEGKNTRALQDEAWERIKEEIEEKADREKKFPELIWEKEWREFKKQHMGRK
jgi:hypothetical protein